MVDILISGGPVMIPLGILSLVAFAIILDRLWTLRRSNYLQDPRIETLSGLLAGNNFRGATEYCRRYPGPFTELVAALVENRNAPYEELKEILEDTGRLQLMGLQRGLPALATIVAGAPLLGSARHRHRHDQDLRGGRYGRVGDHRSSCRRAFPRH